MIEQQTFIPSTWMGMLVGLFLGYIEVRFGFGSVLIAALFAAVGFWAVAFWRGDVQITDLHRLQQKMPSFHFRHHPADRI